MVNYPFNTKLSDLKPGQRFYIRGMWYDFVSIDISTQPARLHVTNGYDDRQFTIFVRPDDLVAISKTAQ